LSKYFGTDGFRGEAGVGLTVEHAFEVGRFLGWYYGRDHKCKVVIGKDTRRSSYMFEYALCAGLMASGADAYILHVITTPGVAFVTRSEDFDCGIMISASHNAYYDNGIKLLNANGEKMEESVIEAVEAHLDHQTMGIPYATGENIGRTVDYAAGRNRYIGYLISCSAYSFKGMRIGLDCANGSTWMIARNVFDALGAKTFVMNDAPSGLNINQDCGSTHMDGLRRFVVDNRLDLGFAFDGDGDRCLAVDEEGNVVTGDHILYVCGKYLEREGLLRGHTVVATVMSNMGLFKALEEAGIACETTNVGDKYVYERMCEKRYSLGGEQSGHVIFRKYATTGDGLLTAILVMQAVMDQKTSLGRLAEPMKLWPQVLKNLRVKEKNAVLNDPAVQKACRDAEEMLGERGRLLVRPSGTEPLLRVMSEAKELRDAQDAVDLVANAIEEGGHLAGGSL